jgi:hypothetical protein
VTILNNFYAMMGHPPEVPGAINSMAGLLLAEANAAQINEALNRCTKECRFPVRLPDIMQRIPGNEIPKTEAMARKAWDVLIAFVKKYVSNDIYGNYGPEHGWYPKTFPKLDDRILDTVRRTGGWIAYARLVLPMESRRPEEDLPFQQKRFFEEYMAWTAVERISDAAHILETHEHPKYLLVGDPPAKFRIHEGNVPLPAVHTMDGCGKLGPITKPIPEPKTEAEIRDRRVMLKQQIAQLAKQKKS